MHIQPETAEHYSVVSGEKITFLATGEHTEGKLAIFYSALPKGHSAPTHVHQIDDEIFYVITGEIEFEVEEQTFVATAGHLIIAGPKVRRSFKAKADSRLLIINAPAGPAEAFLRDITKGEPNDEDVARFQALYGITV